MMAQKRWLYNKLINPECSDGYLAVQSEDFDDNSEVEEFSLIGNRKVLLSETQKMNQSHRIRKNFDNFHLDSRTELMTKNNRRNWRRLLAGGFIAIIVLALLIATIILLTVNRDTKTSQASTASSITLEQWLNGWVSTKSFNGTWLSDDEILYRDLHGNIVIYNCNTASSKIILETSHPDLDPQTVFDYDISPDRKYLLVASNYQKFYRHTYLAEYKIVNLATKTTSRITVGNSTSLQLAVWAPGGNALVLVNQNNVYYKPTAETQTNYQITTTGIYGSIYNAVPDWVYEEEVFSSNKALWFSPSGKKMVFAYFDDTQTPKMEIPYYGIPGSLSFQYTAIIPIHYPKSGTSNPKVKLYYVNLEEVVSNKGEGFVLKEIEHPPELTNFERILAAVAFPTENLVSATWMNRIQNRAYFHLYNVESLKYNTALAYAEKHGWVEQFSPPHFSRTGMEFLLILPQKQLDNDTWPHLVMVTNATSSTPRIRALTSGTFVVTEIVGWDENNSLVYYLATLENDSAQQHLYRVSTIDESLKPECLSCAIKSATNDNFCLYNEAKLSPNGSRYLLTCAGPSVPDISIYNSANATRLIAWEDNDMIAKIVAEKSQPIVKRFSVPVADGFDAQVRLLIPPGADLTGSTKYPMLVYVYGGPDTYQVTEQFNIHWGTYLVTNKNIIYAAIDGRGSGLKGSNMLFAGYRNLGTVEIYDQINVTSHLHENLPYIDKTRTAIWGWSYGGYAAGMSLAMDTKSTFKCGMSVAPVTDWTLYDSIYTERFMGLPTPSDNVGGYEQGQLLNKAANIKSNSYYLIHGTLDDNVHYQQSLLLAKILEENDILFRQQTYTDEDHGILRTRAHLYHSLEKFLDDCLIKS